MKKIVLDSSENERPPGNPGRPQLTLLTSPMKRELSSDATKIDQQLHPE
jgi:hypothetical protein